MKLKQILLSLASLILSQTLSAEALCVNPDVLDLTDRGSITDTPCTVPKNKLLIEGGYLNQHLTPPSTLNSAPLLEMATGITDKSEIFAVLPTYTTQSQPSSSGFSASVVGAKSILLSGQSWAISGQGGIIIPGGSYNFGSPDTGYLVNAIGAYQLNETITLVSMLGGSSLTVPNAADAGRFNSFNYSGTLAFGPVKKYALYVELFGQTKTSPIAGSGLDGDFGVFYTYNEHIVFDIEYGTALQGQLGGVKNYIGAGFTAVI
jgi:hypothetical protein